MEIEIELKKEHWIKFNKFVQKHRQKKLKGFKGGFFSNLVIWFILTFIFIVLFRTVHEWHWPTAIFVMTLFICIILIFFWNIYRLQISLMPSELGTFVGRHRFAFDEDGIHSEGEGYKAHHEWNVIKSVERNDGIIILFLDTAYGFLFPENQLESPTDFINMVNHRSA